MARFRVEIRSGPSDYSPPPAAVASVRWYKERFGGFGACTITLHGEEGTAWLSALSGESLPAFAQVEVWVQPEGSRRMRCRYRGFVTQPALTLSDPWQIQIQALGLMGLIGRRRVDRVIQEPRRVDLSAIAQRVYEAHIAPAFPDVVFAGEPVGVERDRYEWDDTSVQEALDALVEESANTAVWGGFVDETQRTRPNQLVFRKMKQPTDAPDYAFVVPSARVSGAGGECDYTRLANVLHLVGGSPENPNLLPNGGFGRPVRAGGGVGNLFLNGSFAENGEDWTGGGSWKPEGSIEGVGFDAGGYWETDHDGEALEQERTGIVITAGHDHDLVFRYRLEQGKNPTLQRTTFYWTESGVEMADTRIEEEWTATRSLWTAKRWKTRPPAGADGYSFRTEQVSGDGNREGTLFDGCELYDASALRQDGWELDAEGDAQVLLEDWVHEDDAGDGSGCCLRVRVAGATENFESDVALRLRGGARYGVVNGSQIRFIWHMKRSPEGISSPLSVAVLRGFTKEGKQVPGPLTTFTVPAGALDTDEDAEGAGGVAVPGHPGWFRFEVVRDVRQDEHHGEAYLAFQSDGECLVDMLSVRHAAETEWVGDQFRAAFRADELFDEGTPQYESHARYGDRDSDPVRLDGINNRTDAEAYARLHLKVSSVPSTPPRLTILEPDEDLLPGELVRVAGAFGAQLPEPVLPIVQVEEALEGDVFRAEVALGREPRDEASDYLDLVEARLRLEKGGTTTSDVQGRAQPATGGGAYSGIDAVLTDAAATADEAGIVKTDVTGADPVVYLKGSVDTLLAGKANATHSHSAADITSGTLPLGRGGTGATDATGARAAIGAAAASHSHAATDITSGTLNAARLPASGVAAGTYGSLSAIPVLTVDVAGRITAATTAPLTTARFEPALAEPANGTDPPDFIISDGDLVLALTA